MGARYPGNLREALGALGSSGEHSGTLGCIPYIPPLNPPFPKKGPYNMGVSAIRGTLWGFLL